MKWIITLSFLFIQSFVEAKSIECESTDGKSVVVRMVAPHPKEVIVNRPDGETVWVQMADGLLHKQIPDFENLEQWIIDSETVGTVYIDGRPEIQPIIKDRGRYNLYIAENVETEPENTFFIECYFEIKK